MKTNKIINIPKGYEIDKNKSTKRQIVLRSIDKKPKSWEEYCKKMRGNVSFFASSYGDINSSQFSQTPFVTEFDNEDDAKAFVALSKLKKLRKFWVEDWEPDWKNSNVAKFTIIAEENEISKGEHYKANRSMSFPNEEMRDEFFDCFKDLLEQAKTLL